MPLTQIPEQDAEGDIASIYGDIRAVSGLPMVNLIWRHFATFPGVLRWAWDAVSPIVGSEEMDAARERIAETLRLPDLGPLRRADLDAAGLDGRGRAQVVAVTDAYVRGNLTNVVALTALRMRLEEPDAPALPVTAASPALAAPEAIDPLPAIEALDGDLVARLEALAARHDGAAGYVIPSFYVALARWPAVIDALPTWLSPLYEPRAMRAAQESTQQLAAQAAARMLPVAGRPPEAASAIRPVLDRFTTVLIPGAVPVCVAVQRLLRQAA